MRKLEVGLALYRLLDTFRERAADSGDRREVGNRRFAHAPHAPEPAEQRALLGRADALAGAGTLSHTPLGPHLLVIGAPEAVAPSPVPRDREDPPEGRGADVRAGRAGTR